MLLALESIVRLTSAAWVVELKMARSNAPSEKRTRAKILVIKCNLLEHSEIRDTGKCYSLPNQQTITTILQVNGLWFELLPKSKNGTDYNSLRSFGGASGVWKALRFFDVNLLSQPRTALIRME